MNRLSIPAVALAAALAMTGCGASKDDSAAASSSAPASASASPLDNSKRTIYEITTTAEGYSTFGKALKAAGLTKVLDGKGPITVFAPSDPAFSALPPGVLDALLKPENKDVLAKILKYHVIPQAVTSGDVKGEQKVATLEGQTVTLSPEAQLSVNDEAVYEGDIMASNGVAHAINVVLIPPDVDVNTLVSK